MKVTQHTALPNHTCREVIESFGVELPHTVITVDVVKFILPDADRYSKYGVMVNGEYKSNLVYLADLSGNWKEIATSRADAIRHAAMVQDRADRCAELRALIQSTKQPDVLFRAVNEWNDLMTYFLSYGVQYGRKLCLRAGKVEIA